MTKQVHELKGPEQQWAYIQEDNGTFIILDAWNCGRWSMEITFPNIDTARTYLAGRWQINLGSIYLMATQSPELTTDEKIVKLCRQMHRGMLTHDEFFVRFDLIFAEESK